MLDPVILELEEQRARTQMRGELVDRTRSGSSIVASVVETEILSATSAVELERNEQPSVA